MSHDDKPRKRILVVDDERDVTAFLVEVLQGYGFEALAVNNALMVVQSAIDFRPDLILLDFDMPYLLGSDVAVLLKKNNSVRSVPIIFLSGMADEEHRIIANTAGALAYLEKPVEPADLHEAIQVVFGKDERDAR